MVRSDCDDAHFHHRDVLIDGLLIRTVDTGKPEGPAILLLHGWPENWKAWKRVMQELCQEAHVYAIDLPGIGASLSTPPAFDKRTLATIVGHLLEKLDLTDVMLVGSDIGGQIVYSAVQDRLPGITRAVIASVVIPGVDPWQEVLANPYIWHFAFHAVPSLPERLVAGRIGEYFDFFYDRLAAAPERIDMDLRHAFANAYTAPTALRTGFEWYRAFPHDAHENEQHPFRDNPLPVLYLRGRRDRGLSIDRYLDGLRSSGLTNVTGGEIPDSGHFIAIEQPEAFARAILAFIGAQPLQASGVSSDPLLIP